MLISKLSDKKIMIKSEVPIYFGNTNTIIEIINIKIRYRREGDVYLFCQKRGNNIINTLSRKYSIKMKNIDYIYSQNSSYENATIISNIEGFRFNDVSWYRDYQLKKLI